MYFPLKDTDLDRRRKLTAVQRAAAKIYYSKGMKIKDIASKLGVSYSTIYLIVVTKDKRKGILKSKNKYKLKWWKDMSKEKRKDLSHKYYKAHRKYKDSLYQTKISYKGNEK